MLTLIARLGLSAWRRIGSVQHREFVSGCGHDRVVLGRYLSDISLQSSQFGVQSISLCVEGGGRSVDFIHEARREVGR